MGFLSRLFSGQPEAVFILDSKNHTGDVVPSFIDAGIEAHVYSAGKNGEFKLDPMFKGGDYSDVHRDKELELIAQYHGKKGVKAIVLPISSYLNEREAVKIAAKIKSIKSLAGVPVIQVDGEKIAGVDAHLPESDASALAKLLQGFGKKRQSLE